MDIKWFFRLFIIFVLLLTSLLHPLTVLATSYQDFDTYTEIDAGADIVPNGFGVEWWLETEDEAYIYYDFSAGHFDTDFQFDFELKWTSGAVGSWMLPFMLSNALGDFSTLHTANEDMLSVKFSRDIADRNLGIFEGNGGIDTASTSYIITAGTTYYVSFIRDETIGAFGQLDLKIYSDAVRETLLDTKSVTLTEKQDFRYLMVAIGKGGAVGVEQRGTLENLDIGFFSGTVPIVQTLGATHVVENGNLWFRGRSNEDTEDLISMGFEIGTSSENYSSNFTADAWPPVSDEFYKIRDADNFVYAETYYYRAYAVNEYGTGYGSEFTILYLPVPIAVTTGNYFIFGGATGNVSANFYYTIRPSDAIEYDNANFRVSINPVTWTPIIDTYNMGVQRYADYEIWSFSTYNGTGSNIGQLVPDTTYYYQSYALASDNITYYGEIKSFTPTIEDIPPKPIIQMLNVADIGDAYEDYDYVFEASGKLIEFTDNITDLHSDLVSSYGIEWSLSRSSYDLLPLVYKEYSHIKAPDGTFSLVLSFDSFYGTGTDYAGEELHFRVFAVTNNYGEIYSNIVSFTPISRENDSESETGGATPPVAGEPLSETVNNLKASMGMTGVFGSWAFMFIIILSLALLFGSGMALAPTGVAKIAIGASWLVSTIAVVGAFVFTGELGIWPILILVGGMIMLIMVVLGRTLSGGAQNG